MRRSEIATGAEFGLACYLRSGDVSRVWGVSEDPKGLGRKSCRSLCPPGPPYAFADMDNSPCFSLVTGESLEPGSRAMAQSTILQALVYVFALVRGCPPARSLSW